MSAEFLLPENPDYTLLDSARDSVRFAHRCLEPTDDGRWRPISTFVDFMARVQDWHDFGTLEGPGWAANSLGGACLLYHWGAFDHCHLLQHVALGLMDHVLEDGFLQPDGFIWGYRDTSTDSLCLNFKHTDDWFCPGSMAHVALQMLWASDELPSSDARVQRLRTQAALAAEWLLRHVRDVNGWYPRRCTPEGAPCERSADGGPDPIFADSGDGWYIPWLLLELHEHGLGDHSSRVREKVEAVMQRGGIYGSVNHDTYDHDENVAHAIAFRVCLRASRILDWDEARRFGYEDALAGLQRFHMTDDRNGVATRGLLYMEDSRDTAYMWENAEAALAYLEAYEDSGEHHYLCWAATILRAIALHHHGPLGFLTEGVDWNNHVGKQHHIEEAEYGDIRYTEPLLNNLYQIEPVMRYLKLQEECP